MTYSRSTGRILWSGLLSLTGILLILIGIPTALAVLGGNPLEALPSSGSDLWWALTHPDDGTIFIALLTIVAWLVWATLALSFLIEIPAAVRGVPAPKLPGLSWQQGRAAAMTGAVAAMIALGSSGAATAATTSTTAPTQATTTSAPASASTSTTDTSTDSADDSTESVVVHSGDTLWGIAQEELGDGSRYTDVVEANPQRIDDPDVIQPGWTLDLPQAQSEHSGQTPEADKSSGSTGSAKQGDRDSSTPTTEAPVHEDGAATSAPDQGQEGSESSAAPSADASNADPARPSVAPPVGSGAPTTSSSSDTAEKDSRGDSVAPFAITAGLGTLAAAGLLMLLQRLRSRQTRHRMPGRRIARPTSEAAAHAEEMLRETADPIGVEDLNVCLRALGQGAAAGRHARPTLRAARLLPDAIEVYTVEESPDLLPAPWQRVDQLTEGAATQPGTWVLLRRDLHQVTDEMAEGLPAPWPALVTVGFDEHDAHVLLNLEELGSLAVTGDPETARDVVAGLGIELITSSWCDDAQITLVDVMPELVAALDNERVTHAHDLDHVLAGLEHTTGVFRQAYLDQDITDPTHARLTGAVDESWTPHLILTGDAMSQQQAQRLQTILASRPRVAIAAVTCGTDPTSSWVLEVHPGQEGTPVAQLSPAGMTLTPQHLTRQAYLDQLELFDATTHDDVPGPAWAESITDNTPFTLDDLPPSTPEPEGTDAAGVTLTSVNGAGEYTPTTLSATELTTRTHPDIDTSNEDPQADLDDEATTHDGPPDEEPRETSVPPTEDAPEQEDPPPAAAQTPTTETTTPGPTDGAVAELPVAHGPVLKVLGKVEILGAHGPRPASHRRITELVAYLAMHPGSDDKTLSAALFPGEETGPKLSHKRQTYMNSARRWLGRTADGHPYVAEVDEDGYRVTPEVTLDWHCMQDLIGEDISTTSDEALHEALTLVTETPFTGIDPTRWSWAQETMTEISAAVADIAHELATRCLSTGDPRTATWATTKGLLAEPVNELLWRDRITATWATGIPGAAQATIAEARTALEPLGDDLEDETIALINDVIATDRRHA